MPAGGVSDNVNTWLPAKQGGEQLNTPGVGRVYPIGAFTVRGQFVSMCFLLVSFFDYLETFKQFITQYA